MQRAKRVRKQLGSKRVDVTLRDKQAFCQMIRLGQPFKSVQAEYMKKYNKTLSKTIFLRWKKDAESILAVGMKKNACRQSYKRSEIKEEFDRDLMKKIDSAVDLEGLEGLRDMALELSRNDKFKDKDEIENMSFGDDFCRRITKDFNLKATSTLATTLVLPSFSEEASTRKAREQPGLGEERKDNLTSRYEHELSCYSILLEKNWSSSIPKFRGEFFCLMFT